MSSESVVSDMLYIREKLGKMTEIAGESEEHPESAEEMVRSASKTTRAQRGRRCGGVASVFNTQAVRPLARAVQGG